MLQKISPLVLGFTIFSFGITSSYAINEMGDAIDDSIEDIDTLVQDVDGLPGSDLHEQAVSTSIDNGTGLGIEPDESLNDVSVNRALSKDVILVLDNSGSMKKNDPNFLASRAVTEFISSLDAATRIGIIIFDQVVSLVMPLTQLSVESREKC